MLRPVAVTQSTHGIALAWREGYPVTNFIGNNDEI